MRGGNFGGGMGMLGNMRGLQAGGIRTPTMDNLTDEGLEGSAYDNRVVMRLLTYMRTRKREVSFAVAGVLIYTVSSVALPFILKLGIDAFTITDVNPVADKNQLHLLAAVFLVVTLVHFGSNFVQFVYMPRVGQGILYDLRHPDVHASPEALYGLLPSHTRRKDHVP